MKSDNYPCTGLKFRRVMYCRKYMEKNDHGMYYPANYLELEPDFHPCKLCKRIDSGAY